jgi:hypothetical protein
MVRREFFDAVSPVVELMATGIPVVKATMRVDVRVWLIEVRRNQFLKSSISGERELWIAAGTEPFIMA